MSKLAPEELVALGLRPDAQLTQVESDKAPARPVALGRAAATHDTLSLEALVDRLREHPHTTPVALKQWSDIAPGARLDRWDPEPEIAIFRHEEGQRFRVVGNNKRLDVSTLALDSRERPVGLRLDHAGSAWVVHFERGNVSLAECRTGTHATEAASWEPTGLPEVPAPDIRAWLGPFEVPAWLMTEAERLAQETWSLARVAAAGLVARLWEPVDGAALARATQRLSSGEEGPTEAAVRWFRALPVELREGTERSALVEVDMLEERLPELEQVAMEDPEQVSALGGSWLHRRDDLESILFLLTRAGASEALSVGLAALDQRASEFLSLWELLELEEDERLHAVSWQEPEAWWGQLALA